MGRLPRGVYTGDPVYSRRDYGRLGGLPLCVLAGLLTSMGCRMFSLLLAWFFSCFMECVPVADSFARLRFPFCFLLLGYPCLESVLISSVQLDLRDRALLQEALGGGLPPIVRREEGVSLMESLSSVGGRCLGYIEASALTGANVWLVGRLVKDTVYYHTRVRKISRGQLGKGRSKEKRCVVS